MYAKEMLPKPTTTKSCTEKAKPTPNNPHCVFTHTHTHTRTYIRKVLVKLHRRTHTRENFQLPLFEFGIFQFPVPPLSVNARCQTFQCVHAHVHTVCI